MTFINKYRKELTGIGVYILFFVISDLLLAILYSFGIDLNQTSSITKQIIGLVRNLVFPILLIIIYKDDLIDDIKKAKKDYRKYIEVGIMYYAIGLVGMVASNFILQNIFDLGLASNETSVREMIKTIPVYMFFTTCFIAPFQEEMVFRKVFKDIFKNKIFFIIFSGIIFGLLHVVGEFENYMSLLFFIPYGFLGSMFALIYCKTDNILAPIGIHLLHNTALVLLQLNMM